MEKEEHNVDDRMNASVEQMELFFDERRGNAERFIRRTIKEDKKTGKHELFQAPWNGVAYSNDLKPLDTKSLKQAISQAREINKKKQKTNKLRVTPDFMVPDETIVGFVYMLRFAKGYYYIGETNNLHSRMGNHRTSLRERVLSTVFKRGQKALPEGFTPLEAKIRKDSLLEALRHYFIKSGEISKGTVQISKAVRAGKITEKNLKDALKDITTNQVIILDIQIAGEERALPMNYKASEQWHIGALNSENYVLMNNNFVEYSLKETALLMKSSKWTEIYPWDSTALGESFADTWDYVGGDKDF